MNATIEQTLKSYGGRDFWTNAKTINAVASVTGKLKADFPQSVPTHSRRQEFYIDAETGLLKQHNYAANVISKLAYAANVVHEHAQTNGIPYVSRRIVTPQGFSGKPLRGPVLIDIRVHALRIY